MEAFHASLDTERPSGDDPKQVALALQRFFGDLANQLKISRPNRWRTPLFRELEPKINADLKALRAQIDAFISSGSTDLVALKNHDESLRRATFSLQKEEAECGLPLHPSPKINQLNYLFEGWKRGLLGPEPLAQFLTNYGKTLTTTEDDLKQVPTKAGARESERETQAVETAIERLSELRVLTSKLQSRLATGATACEGIVKSLWDTGLELGKAFATLEECAPVTEPCPFCGGRLSLSGRCGSCGRRVPHLQESEGGDQGPESPFQSNNCRKVDLALTAWEEDRSNRELWQAFREAVREFGSGVVQGRKSAEMLAMDPERPIDSQSSMRQKEEVLLRVGQAFQDALTLLSKFSQDTDPPAETIDPSWREPLLAAEAELKTLEESLQPEQSS